MKRLLPFVAALTCLGLASCVSFAEPSSGTTPVDHGEIDGDKESATKRVVEEGTARDGGLEISYSYEGVDATVGIQGSALWASSTEKDMFYETASPRTHQKRLVQYDFYNLNSLGIINFDISFGLFNHKYEIMHFSYTVLDQEKCPILNDIKEEDIVIEQVTVAPGGAIPFYVDCEVDIFKFYEATSEREVVAKLFEEAKYQYKASCLFLVYDFNTVIIQGRKYIKNLQVEKLDERTYVNRNATKYTISFDYDYSEYSKARYEVEAFVDDELKINLYFKETITRQSQEPEVIEMEVTSIKSGSEVVDPTAK